jgi:hypothetical protein
MPGLEGFLLHPVRIPFQRKRTRRRLLSSRLMSVPVPPEPRIAVKGMLWRGHAIQGRCQPGRRAVLEETKEPSDRRYSTLNGAFSQANTSLKSPHIALIIYHIAGFSRRHKRLEVSSSYRSSGIILYYYINTITILYLSALRKHGEFRD